jgi:DNA-binding response OmpR family regulator
MIKSQIHILIVEDDFTQGNALCEAFTRAGYTCVLCTTSVQALTSAQRNEYHCLIVDCLLPKMNGVDLVEEILQFLPTKPKIFMMTGIFKDKAFIKDAMDRTGATSFFVKPINLADIIGTIDEIFAPRIGPETPPVLRLYSTDPLSDDELTSVIARESTIHSFHLPKLYQRMQKSSLWQSRG